MPVRGVVHHQVHDHANAADLRLVRERHEVAQVSQARIHAVEVRDVVAVVAVRRRVEGQQPEGGDPQAFAPLLVGAAVTPETAEWVGSWADGLITTSRPPDQLRKVVEAFHRGGGDGKPMFLKVQLSWAPTEEEAVSGAHEQWASNIYSSQVLTDLPTPAHFEQLAQRVKPEEMEGHVRTSANLERHLEWLAQDVELGFSRLVLHNVNRGQEAFIDAFGEKVIPKLMR
jgi:coenzyme F420-dependent glucose-6-phosphate dehydrogenase